MPSRPLYIVDVFAEQKYAGNQLAVIRDGQSLPEAMMQKIAREMNFSETTFILSDTPRDGGYDVRIFTPVEELPFAGHPTLGTAYIIQKEILQKSAPKIVLNLKVGQIPVTFEHDQTGSEILWMTQKPPSFGRTLDPRQVSEVLAVPEKDVDNNFPIEEVSTGVSFIIVPLKTLAAVKQVTVDRARFLALVKSTEAKSILVFCPETYNPENKLNVRVFSPYLGVPEDPGTGSGNGCLAAYLVKHRFLGTDRVDTRVEQGYEIGRPSLLYLRAGWDAGSITVRVGGKVQNVARGELF